MCGRPSAFTLFDIWLFNSFCEAVWRLNALPKDIQGEELFPDQTPVQEASGSESSLLNLQSAAALNIDIYICEQAAWMISAFFLSILLSQSNFLEYVIVNMNRGQSFSLLEAKNHICSNGGAQSVSQVLIEAGTKLNCLTFEWSLGNQPALGVEGSAVAPRIIQARGLWWGAGVQRNLKRTCSLSRLTLMRGINCRLSAFSELGSTRFG